MGNELFHQKGTICRKLFKFDPSAYKNSKTDVIVIQDGSNFTTCHKTMKRKEEVNWCGAVTSYKNILKTKVIKSAEDLAVCDGKTFCNLKHSRKIG